MGKPEANARPAESLEKDSGDDLAEALSRLFMI